MITDVVDLRDFYHSRLGHVTARLMRAAVRGLWPNLSGMTLVGVGYATPLLRPFVGEARSVAALMPRAQGVLHWPSDAPGLTLLGEEAELPFASGSIDRVVLAHIVETTHHLPQLMEEVWRVLGPFGRVIVVAPGRAGVWARTDRTPFGHGRSFSNGQVTRLLRDHQFTPTETTRCLFFPPVDRRVLLAAAPAWEEIGRRWLPQVAGVVVVEATKQVYGGLHVRAPARRRAPVFAGQAATARQQVERQS
ncbi:MAG: methyltransferase domain-containing protein [Alphaproteobacteria bacterium]|nr:methyltransferase domain-containing protein [Alphaproteobacteria bacterium]TAD87996.1 MAG: methyltransferase domain-containing protein [Alphaproteobacteria bacterium]